MIKLCMALIVHIDQPSERHWVNHNVRSAVSKNAQFLGRGPKAALVDWDAGSMALHINYAGGASSAGFSYLLKEWSFLRCCKLKVTIPVE